MPVTVSRSVSGSPDRSTVPIDPATGWKPDALRAPVRILARQIADSGCTGPPSNSTAGSGASEPHPPSTSATGISVALFSTTPSAPPGSCATSSTTVRSKFGSFRAGAATSSCPAIDSIERPPIRCDSPYTAAALLSPGDAEFIALGVGEDGPGEVVHLLLTEDRGAQRDQPVHLGQPVLGQPVDVRAVLADPALRDLLQAEPQSLVAGWRQHHVGAPVIREDLVS